MDFKEYLEQKGGVKSKNIPFYLQWVNKYQDWQIEQVADAVKHFLYYQNHYSRGQNRDSQDSGDNPLWICARKTFREALRLKHRSYQTEKSYIHWLDSFLVLLKNKNPDDVTEKNLKSFLTYLAVERGVFNPAFSDNANHNDS